MDVRCRFCGEPVDMDEFHNGNDEFGKIAALFREYGCPIADQAIDGERVKDMVRTQCDREPIVDVESIDGIGLIQDLLGDDMDGVAAMTDDYFFFDRDTHD